MTIQLLRRIAVVVGVLLPAVETFRRWHQLGDIRVWPFWLDDWAIGGFLLMAAWKTRSDVDRGHAWLAAACGFLEPVYREALAVELARRHVPFEAEPLVAVRYKERRLATVYRPDFVCFDQLIVELKALAAFPVNLAQAINYLKATGLERALLLNFGGPRLEYRRVILSR